MDFGFATIGSIAVICFVVAQILKLIPKIRHTDGLIPVLVLITGAGLGIVGSKTGILGLEGLDTMSAIATGVVSGAAASGLFSWYKDIQDAFDE